MKTICNYILEKLKLNKQSQTIDDPNDMSTWAPGNILCGIWSYSMVIPYFYKILKRTAKSFTIVEIKSKIVSGSFNGQYEVVPKEPYEEDGRPKTIRINKHGGLNVGRVNLSKWNGKPLHGDGMD